MPSAQMALDLVNNRSDILPDYELELIHYDSMVSACARSHDQRPRGRVLHDFNIYIFVPRV